jgi:phosphoribosylglycinamide formyltransferase-1
MRPRIAVLASGGGTTVESFIRADQANEINVEVALVISSRNDAGVIQRIADLNQEFDLHIQTLVINPQSHPAADGEQVSKGAQTQAEEAAILEVLKKNNFDLVSLMGYMKKIGPSLIKEYGWLPEYSSIFQASMVNTHPGLLPDTKGFFGENIQQYVLDNNLPYGGQTFHVVAEEYDAGPVIAEHKVPVGPGDTPESLFARVQATEKQYLPKDLEDFVLARIAYNEANKGD